MCTGMIRYVMNEVAEYRRLRSADYLPQIDDLMIADARQLRDILKNPDHYPIPEQALHDLYERVQDFRDFLLTDKHKPMTKQERLYLGLIP